MRQHFGLVLCLVLSNLESKIFAHTNTKRKENILLVTHKLLQIILHIRANQKLLKAMTSFAFLCGKVHKGTP